MAARQEIPPRIAQPRRAIGSAWRPRVHRQGEMWIVHSISARRLEAGDEDVRPTVGRLAEFRCDRLAESVQAECIDVVEDRRVAWIASVQEIEVLGCWRLTDGDPGGNLRRLVRWPGDQDDAIHVAELPDQGGLAGAP